jgi:pteridine reductase
MQDLKDKVALVTGAARRVGAAIARKLHAHGATVLLHHRGAEAEAAALEAELNALRPGSAARVKADLLAHSAPELLVRTALERFGRLDLLVNNASSFFPTAVGEVNEKSWEDLIGTNVKAPLLLSQAAAPALAQVRGSIVNIVDIHAERPLKGYVVYSIAKAGLAALTRSLAMELAPEVRVNGVSPGAIAWPEDGQFPPEVRQHIIEDTLLKRLGDPEDIARAVLFLAAGAPYVTGQVIAVDGGRSVNI